MAADKPNPYRQFNFTVDLGRGIRAGFQECSRLGMESATAEYRHETAKSALKIKGLDKAGDVTLKRGVIAAADLQGWLEEIRRGLDKGARKVTINLMSEDKNDSKPVLSWRLSNARVIKYVGEPKNAKGTDVAMEELTLSYERLEMD
jgi:phage tail-like protein